MAGTYHGKPCVRCGATLRRKYNADCIACRRRRYRGDQVTQRLQRARVRATKRGLECGPMPAAAAALKVLGQECPACGNAMVPETRHAPSLDRVNNERGYTDANVVVICKNCNARKGCKTAEEIWRLVDRAAERNTKLRRLAVWLTEAEAQAISA